MKICVIGHSGAGKSTLAHTLGEKYGVPVLHLDATFWYGDWQNRSRAEQSVIVNNFMQENDGWVIDGNYFHICLNRFEECDAVYFLNFNRFFCFKEALKRYKKYKGTVRPDCPCYEKFDFEFAKWILLDGRSKKKKAQIKNILSICNGKSLTFKTRKDLNRFLQKKFG